jgi:hypothetical protein
VHAAVTTQVRGGTQEKITTVLAWLYALLGHAAAVHDSEQDAQTTWQDFVDKAVTCQGEVQDMYCSHAEKQTQFEALQAELCVAGGEALPGPVWAEFANGCDIDTGEDLGPDLASGAAVTPNGNVAALSCSPAAEEPRTGETSIAVGPTPPSAPSTESAGKKSLGAANMLDAAAAKSFAATNAARGAAGLNAVYMRNGQLKAPTPRKRLPEPSPARPKAEASPLVRGPGALAPERLQATPLQEAPYGTREDLERRIDPRAIPAIKLDLSAADEVDANLSGCGRLGQSLLDDDDDDAIPDAAEIAH